MIDNMLQRRNQEREPSKSKINEKRIKNKRPKNPSKKKRARLTSTIIAARYLQSKRQMTTKIKAAGHMPPSAHRLCWTLRC
jgi:hypothetical protein